MPKMKSHRGAAKRVEVTSTGKIRRRRAFANHMLGKKTSTRKRRLTSPALVSDSDTKRIRRLLGR
ncbi:MAG TPA: 50S ribosomal protein L35 [Actinomycetota bacterium]|nr:50S ribosomal protein L35 [Actinomycetota bacterium]